MDFRFFLYLFFIYFLLFSIFFFYANVIPIHHIDVMAQAAVAGCVSKWARVTKVIQFRCPYGQVHRFGSWQGVKRRTYMEWKTRGGRERKGGLYRVGPLWRRIETITDIQLYTHHVTHSSPPPLHFSTSFSFLCCSCCPFLSFLIGLGVQRDDINTPTQPPLWPHPLRRPTPSFFMLKFVFFFSTFDDHRQRWRLKRYGSF